MTVGVALLVGALFAAAVGHRVLQLACRMDMRPRLLIATWMVTAASTVLTFIAGVALIALPGHGGIARVLSRVGGCLSALQHGAVPQTEEWTAAAGGALLTALLVRFGVVAVRRARLQRRRRDRYRFLSNLAAVPGSTHADVLWLQHTHPIAFSVAGRPGLIAASQGLRDRLPPMALAATLEHERAHLRGHHHMIVDLADIAAAAFPLVPLFRIAPNMIRELVEMAADDVAGRRFGKDAVLQALTILAVLSAPSDGLAMASTAVVRRVSRLMKGGRFPARGTSAACVAAIAAVGVVLPSMIGVGLLFSLACSVG